MYVLYFFQKLESGKSSSTLEAPKEVKSNNNNNNKSKHYAVVEEKLFNQLCKLDDKNELKIKLNKIESFQYLNKADSK